MQYGAAAAEQAWYMPAAAMVVAAAAETAAERVERLASESAVVVFSVSSCCMCHAVKRLFCGMGVHPALVGAMDRVMAAHINGSLVPLLKEAGALWL
uniref:Uncharacterized protein n=1 Tax=Oryza glumipatula TaxID=40148 RepID=A0A0D9ZK38_9ORYZ